MAADEAPVWFITGCPTGFGRELARQVIARGWRAAVTARGKARAADLVEGAGNRGLALDLDVTDAGQVAAAARAAVAEIEAWREVGLATDFPGD